MRGVVGLVSKSGVGFEAAGVLESADLHVTLLLTELLGNDELLLHTPHLLLRLLHHLQSRALCSGRFDL